LNSDIHFNLQKDKTLNFKTYLHSPIVFTDFSSIVVYMKSFYCVDLNIVQCLPKWELLVMQKKSILVFVFILKQTHYLKMTAI